MDVKPCHSPVKGLHCRNRQFMAQHGVALYLPLHLTLAMHSCCSRCGFYHNIDRLGGQARRDGSAAPRPCNRCDRSPRLLGSHVLESSAGRLQGEQAQNPVRSPTSADLPHVPLAGLGLLLCLSICGNALGSGCGGGSPPRSVHPAQASHRHWRRWHCRRQPLNALDPSPQLNWVPTTTNCG